MPRDTDRPNTPIEDQSAGPRAILRVPEVLLALAAKREGCSLAELSARLDVPKTSLHRLLHTLVRGGYLTRRADVYVLGAASFHLASVLARAAPSSAFPACARPVMEALASDTRETVLLGALEKRKLEIVYVDVIDSVASVRFTIPVGDRRPLYSAASGKAVLAFLTRGEQAAYLSKTRFTPFTPHTTRKTEMSRVLREIQRTALAFDRDGRVEGASAIASPIFDAEGKVFASVSVAGPTERIEAERESIGARVSEAGERISRLVGFGGAYPRGEGVVSVAGRRTGTG